MNERVKNYFNIALVIGIITVAYSLWTIAQSYSRSIEPSSFRSFSVSAEGKAVAIPDIATFSFGVVTEGGKNIADLQKENTKKINDAIALLKLNNIQEKDIKTQNYSISPRYQSVRCSITAKNTSCPPPEIVGYTISQDVSVKIRDFSKISPVLAGIVKSGVNSVSGLIFAIDNPIKVESVARKEAMKKAREKAAEIASAGGFSIGRVLSISEGSYPPIYRLSALQEKGFGGADISGAPTIEPGSEDVVINVTITYEIR